MKLRDPAFCGIPASGKTPPFRGERIFRRLFFLAAVFVTLSCGTSGPVQETPLPADIPPPASETGREQPVPRPSAGGVADEIRRLTETGVLSSMLRALDLIRSRGLGATEFGRLMNGVNVALIRRVYPDASTQLPVPDLPQTHVYARILREAERGGYTPPSQGSTDYLEYVLPFLALYTGASPPAESPGRGGTPGEAGLPPLSERFRSALPDLQKAETIKPDSALAPYFLGLAYERTNMLAEAQLAYNRAYDISGECYPAALGLARVMNLSGRKQEALRMLSDLVIRYPDNTAVKRQLALTYYENGDWSRAEPAIAEILQRDNRDGDFLLMRARILVEQGRYMQAQAPLDLYSSLNPNNRTYLFLRARVQAEGYRNRDAALNYLRSILRSSPDDDEASVYAAQLLMESSRSEDQAEGGELFRRLLAHPNPSAAVLGLGLQDAIRRENWREAQRYLGRLLEERRSFQDLLNACTVERGLGNNARVLSYARELYERDPFNEEGIAAYISALIDTGRPDEAGRMIESRLSAPGGATVKSRYYYLRSRIRTSEESAMNDLRSSLFEDPRNLNALIALFEIYHRRRDERRAVYYLKQALAIAPDNPHLKRYEGEYAGLLGGAN
ncbi:MAG: tetratricopeptide repeat protein [Treponema sp.]|nr:tetratricopeptide repeat protein [Treponema sp.]